MHISEINFNIISKKLIHVLQCLAMAHSSSTYNSVV